MVYTALYQIRPFRAQTAKPLRSERTDRFRPENLATRWKMEAGIQCLYSLTAFPRFRREPARTKHSLTPNAAALFMLVPTGSYWN